MIARENSKKVKRFRERDGYSKQQKKMRMNLWINRE